jgi:preprotein translocase subunit SecY
MKTAKYPTNKLFRAAGISYLVLFVLFILCQNYLPIDLRNSPVLDKFYGLGSGILISIIAGIHAYYSWSLDSKEYTEWLESQKIGIAKSEDVSSFAKSHTLWLMRIIAPIGVFFGLALTIIMSVIIFKYFYLPTP